MATLLWATVLISHMLVSMDCSEGACKLGAPDGAECLTHILNDASSMLQIVERNTQMAVTFDELQPPAVKCCLAAGPTGACGVGCLSWADAGDFCDSFAVNCHNCSGTWCSEALVSPTPGFTAPTPAIPNQGSNSWITGTWTTGYWDCCKPSCSWPNRGSVTHPMHMCDIHTGHVISDPTTKSVCDGGTAATCANNQPFVINAKLSMGFAAAATAGFNNLVGNANCGQCYELLFVDQRHQNWGGAAQGLVGKTMIVQVSNIGYDVKGPDHSFDILIPSAGQGLHSNGCQAQFPGFTSSDFDCGIKFGGCSNIAGCNLQPPALRSGCDWRYNWYYWMAAGGQTNNPFVNFRRVQCPAQLTAISGMVATDDNTYPAVDLSSFD